MQLLGLLLCDATCMLSLWSVYTNVQQLHAATYVGLHNERWSSAGGERGVRDLAKG